jgi:hypothetical protein
MQLFVVTVTVTRLDVALPFLLSAGLLLISSCTGEAISQRLEKVLTEWFEGVQEVDLDTLPTPLRPAALASTTAWTVDAAQILATVLAPAIGLLILRPEVSSGITLLYLASFVVAVVAFISFTFRVRADKYASHVWLWLFTPVSVVGLLLELAAAGVAAWVLGPK